MIKEGLIWLGNIITFLIYWKYREKIKKVINELLPFWAFYILLSTLFKVIIRVSFE